MRPAEKVAWIIFFVAAACQWYQGKGVIGPSKASIDHVVILDETATPSTEFAQLFADLRDESKSATQFLSQGRKFDITDKDVKDENGNPKYPPAVYEGVTLPAIFLYDKRTLVHRESLARSDTADSVADKVRSHSK